MEQDSALKRITGVSGTFPLVMDVSDRALIGIHAAIPLPHNSNSDLSQELPTYIPRDVDADLRAALRSKVATGGFFLLVGRAASGKTRCAYEAIRSTLAEWRLCIPPNAESLNLLVESDVDFTKTVIWLDEIQRFLEPGKLSLETTQRLLLQRDSPVVIVGTIWPEKYSQLRGTGSEERSEEIRRVLELGRRFDILDFTEAEQARAREISRVDPRVSEALSDGPCPRLTENLAAAPELVHRWMQADSPLGGAVVTAAVSARLLGHPQPIGGEILLKLTLSQLDGIQRATAPDDWFEQALNWATLPVKGASAPMSAYAREIGRISGYIASDLLVQYAQSLLTVKKFTISNSFGELLISLSTPEACASIGLTTEKWEDSRLSLLAYKTAADSGNGFAATAWGAHLEEEGETMEAVSYLSRAAESGYVPAMTLLAISFSRLGEEGDALRWARLAATTSGDASATGTLGALLYKYGNREEALTWTKASIRAGGRVAIEQLALLLDESSEIEVDIVDRVRIRAEEGSVAAMQALGRILIRNEQFDLGIHWLESAANEGDGVSARLLSRNLLERGEVDKALSILQASAESGDTNSMAVLGMTLSENGELEDAVHWARRAAEGGPMNMLTLGIILWVSGQQEEAREWFDRVDASGDEKAREILSNYAREEGIPTTRQ